MEISTTTRRLLFDELILAGVDYNGALSEIEFLERLYDLTALPSTDGRRQYENLRDDIQQHRVANDDYEDGWIWSDPRLGLLHGSDENLLKFLAEMVHPLVRRKEDDVASILKMVNAQLLHDGFEIARSGASHNRAIYGGRKVAVAFAGVLEAAIDVPNLGDHARSQIERMRASVETSPSLAIGTAKELIETVSKTILRRRGIPYAEADEAPRLAKMVVESVDVIPRDWKGDARSEGAIKALVGYLVQVATRLSELRNRAGTGHGREAEAVDLSPMHARLAVDAAATFAAFILAADGAG